MISHEPRGLWTVPWVTASVDSLWTAWRYRALGSAQTADHNLPTAALDKPAGLPTTHLDNPPDCVLRVPHTDHSPGGDCSPSSLSCPVFGPEKALEVGGRSTLITELAKAARPAQNLDATTGKNSCRQPEEVVDASHCDDRVDSISSHRSGCSRERGGSLLTTPQRYPQLTWSPLTIPQLPDTSYSVDIASEQERAIDCPPAPSYCVSA